MRIAKLEQSCLVLEIGDSTLVIDPGSETSGAEALRGVVAVVVTHEHADHWSAAQLESIRSSNPDLVLFSTERVVQAASQLDPPVAGRVVRAGEIAEVGPFSLRFFGGTHALIHKTIELIDNVAVLVNDELYSAGDSLTVPEGATVSTLAVPIGAPWLRIGDAMDFVEQVRPKRTIPVHELTLSAMGRAYSNARITESVTRVGGEHVELGVGGSLTLFPEHPN
ncbi:MAG: fold metallo-hydrolase [Rhodoglobus sp.]|nr:fold metallo-hydrolase [Rhodoglobus sp.]